MYSLDYIFENTNDHCTVWAYVSDKKIFRFLDGAFRLDESDAGLPTIPVHPINYGDAANLLRFVSYPIRAFWSHLHTLGYTTKAYIDAIKKQSS